MVQKELESCWGRPVVRDFAEGLIKVKRERG